jgi:hypothetical protein
LADLIAGVRSRSPIRREEQSEEAEVGDGLDEHEHDRELLVPLLERANEAREEERELWSVRRLHQVGDQSAFEHDHPCSEVAGQLRGRLGALAHIHVDPPPVPQSIAHFIEHRLELRQCLRSHAHRPAQHAGAIHLKGEPSAESNQGEESRQDGGRGEAGGVDDEDAEAAKRDHRRGKGEEEPRMLRGVSQVRNIDCLGGGDP